MLIIIIVIIVFILVTENVSIGETTEKSGRRDAGKD